ncbi:MAG: hypothetical protein ABIT05_04885 [Chitinophagaceae bacterium]
MKKILFLFFLFFTSLATYAQGPGNKIAADIKKLSGEYLADFKNIKGALKSDDTDETVYYSRLKLAGSVDSTNLVHFAKESQFWKFTADMDKEKISADELNVAILSVNFSFGKVKGIPTGAEWASTYVPQNKKGLTGKIRSFVIFLLNAEENPRDQAGRKLSFSLGQEDYYMNK